MKIKNYTCKCGNDDWFFVNKGNQVAIYCSRCGKWLKWADKDEQNLRVKDEQLTKDKIEGIIGLIESSPIPNQIKTLGHEYAIAYVCGRSDTLRAVEDNLLKGE